MEQKRQKIRTFAGVDVGGKELVVALVRKGGPVIELTLPNTREGHKNLVQALKKANGPARVVLGATGTFHLDAALHAAKQANIEISVVNPLASRRFAQAQMRRAKTGCEAATG